MHTYCYTELQEIESSNYKESIIQAHESNSPLENTWQC